jgi:hypothetical protein
VVGLDEELGRTGKWLVGREPGGLGVSVGTDEREVADFCMESAGNASGDGVRRKEAVVVEQSHGAGGHRPG